LIPAAQQARWPWAWEISFLSTVGSDWPLPAHPLGFCCGLKPAAVGFKVAFRAAWRPEIAGLDKAGPRPAQGLKALLVRKPALLAPGAPGP
jgi:hypothetical protein